LIDQIVSNSSVQMTHCSRRYQTTYLVGF